MRRVVDTNVLVTANGANATATAACVAACGQALRQVSAGHLFIDGAGAIVTEYRNNVAAFGDPRAGNAFLKWVLTNEWNPERVTRVELTSTDEAPGYEELPAPTGGVIYDPSDCVFLAVSAAHPEHPPIVQALDSKWWGWVNALAKAGVPIDFVCPNEIASKHAEKMNS